MQFFAWGVNKTNGPMILSFHFFRVGFVNLTAPLVLKYLTKQERVVPGRKSEPSPSDAALGNRSVFP